MRLDARTVALALRDEFCLGEAERIWPVEQGSFNRVFAADLPGRRVFVRVNRDPDALLVEREAYQLCAEHRVPVPEVIGYLPRSARIGYPTLVLAEAVGEPLDRLAPADDERRRLFERAGAMLRRVHGVGISGFGSLALRDGKLRGTSASWHAYWASDNRNDRDLAAIVRDGLVSGGEFARVERAVAAMREVVIPRPVLLHNDFHGPHLFTDGHSITGVIDFGNALAGDPRYDLAMALFFCRPAEAVAFKRGYGALAFDPLIEVYAIYVAAIKVLWRHRVGNVAGTEDALQKLQAAIAS